MNKPVAIGILLLMGLWALKAQDINELEAQREKTLKQIALTQKLLDETDVAKRKNLNYINMLRKQIENRRYLITSLNSEISILVNNIEDSRSLVQALEEDIQALKTEYANMLYLAYRNNLSTHYLAFLFASTSLNDAWKRYKIYKYYTEYRKDQVELIKATKASLEQKVGFLKGQISNKESLLGKLEAERERLLTDRSKRSVLISELKNQEEDYRKKLRKEKQLADELDKAIEEIIRKEAAKKAENNEIDLDAEELTSLFTQNQSRLPWPAEGVVTSNFGRQAHPSIPNVYINNNGIDITTPQNAVAQAVFSGKVIHVIYIPGANYAIIMQHGDYYTVYKNLVDVSVEPGDKLAKGADLGTVYYDASLGATILHFEVRKQTEKLNPVLWLEKN